MGGAIRPEGKHALEAGERLAERDGLAHVRLAVVGHDDDGVALEQLLDAAGRVGERADRVVAAAQHLERRVGPRCVRGVVVVGEVEEEEVEGVTRHEPAPDGRRVRVDRARRAVAPQSGAPVRSELKRL